MVKDCYLVGHVAQVEFNLDSREQVQEDLHMAGVQGAAESWAGSDRNRAPLNNKGNSMHSMQIAQSPINTGDCASR